MSAASAAAREYHERFRPCRGATRKYLEQEPAVLGAFEAGARWYHEQAKAMRIPNGPTDTNFIRYSDLEALFEEDKK